MERTPEAFEALIQHLQNFLRNEREKGKQLLLGALNEAVLQGGEFFAGCGFKHGFAERVGFGRVIIPRGKRDIRAEGEGSVVGGEGFIQIEAADEAVFVRLKAQAAFDLRRAEKRIRRIGIDVDVCGIRGLLAASGGQRAQTVPV